MSESWKVMLAGILQLQCEVPSEESLGADRAGRKESYSLCTFMFLN